MFVLSHLEQMSKYCNFDFDFDQSKDLFNPLDNLRLEVTFPATEEETGHLEALIDASKHSQVWLGRLGDYDDKRMQDLGRSTKESVFLRSQANVALSFRLSIQATVPKAETTIAGVDIAIKGGLRIRLRC
jgi:hypothetical protein